MATPVLKWPGGKRWLAPSLVPLFSAELSNQYFEPFLGAGAIFLSLCPTKAVLSDCNSELISFLEIVRRVPVAVIKAVWRFQNTRECYYRVRGSTPSSEVGRAARFLYLNRTCWGGIYRLNKRGEFNVPFGGSERIICRQDQLLSVAQAFEGAQLRCCDFSDAIAHAGRGDVVYCDPPYTTKGAGNGFVRYNESLFRWSDQIRLSHVAKAAKRRGAFVAVSGLDHFAITNLYRGWWKCSFIRPSLVSCDISSRRSISELVVLSRKPRVCHTDSLCRIE